MQIISINTLSLKATLKKSTLPNLSIEPNSYEFCLPFAYKRLPSYEVSNVMSSPNTNNSLRKMVIVLIVVHKRKM